MPTSTKDIIAEEIYEALTEAQGEKSETNLVDSITNLVKQNSGNPISLSLGAFGNQAVISALKPGGTPKTDVLVKTTSRKYPEIGISMKLPNADFLDNRRTNVQVYDMIELFTRGNTEASDILLSTIISEMEYKSNEWQNSKVETTALEEAVEEFRLTHPSLSEYSSLKNYRLKWTTDGIDPQSVLVGNYPPEAIAAIAAGFTARATGNTGLEANVYSLSSLFDKRTSLYRKIIEGLLGGESQTPPIGANAYFLGDITSSDYSAAELEEAFTKPWGATQSLTTIPAAARELKQHYDPSFRLRAITPARAVLSNTNMSHYKKGEKEHSGKTGLSWTTFFIKVR